MYLTGTLTGTLSCVQWTDFDTRPPSKYSLCIKMQPFVRLALRCLSQTLGKLQHGLRQINMVDSVLIHYYYPPSIHEAPSLENRECLLQKSSLRTSPSDPRQRSISSMVFKSSFNFLDRTSICSLGSCQSMFCVMKGRLSKC